MLRALANCMAGRDFPGLGALPGMQPVELLIDHLDRRMGQWVYSLVGWSEIVPPEEMHLLRAEDISEAVVSMFPRDTGDAVMIGSANGALIHLCAALRAPWLPQTFLVPLHRPNMDPDNILGDMEWGRAPGALLLENNPELVLHHMHDPDHDRLMVRRMAYFRIKRRALGAAYTRFLTEKLRAGATVYLVECGMKWPTSQVAERHVFQTGGAGGISAQEYLNGSERVARFLHAHGSRLQRWEAPQVDGESPEAEWGFEPELRKEVIALVREQGGRIVRVSFDEPEDMSPLIAGFYRWWYRRLGIPDNHLLVESFALVDPFWTFRTGSVPFWSLFSGRRSAERVNRYLSESDPYDRIYVMLLSNGMEPVEGLSIEHWRSVLQHAQVKGEFLGVDEQKFPYDFASFLKYNAALKQQIPDRYAPPSQASTRDVDEFLRQYGHLYNVVFEEVT